MTTQALETLIIAFQGVTTLDEKYLDMASNM